MSPIAAKDIAARLQSTQMPRRMLTCRLNFVRGAGGSSFKIDQLNYRAALYCHDKYACPALCTASTQRMECFAEDQIDNGISMPGELS